LALRDVENVSDFLKTFSGTDRDITAYLAEIVLSYLPEDLAQFIMRSALLDKFSVALCRDVLKREDAVEMVNAARSQNLFLVSLDRQDTWFRYHHLFADFLRNRYLASDPAQAQEVYAAASVWFEDDGALNDAIRYAIAAKQFERAANLIARCAHEMVTLRGEHAMFLGWIDALPRHLVAQRPPLRLAQIGSLLRTHRYSDADQLLHAMEQDIASESAKTDDAGLPVDGNAPIGAWARKVELMRLTYLSVSLNTALAGPRGIQWLATAGQGDQPAEIANALNVVGYDAFFRNDYDGALRYFGDAKKSYEKGNAYYGVAYAETLRCMVELERGNVNVADRILRDAEAVVAKELGPHSYGGSVLWVPRVRVSYEQSNIREADQMLDSLFFLMNRRNCSYPFIIKARILSLRQQFDDADAFLQLGISQFERMGVQLTLPVLHAERIHLMLKRGLTTQALAVAESIDLFERKATARSSVGPSTGDLELRLSVVRLKLATGQGSVLALLNDLIAEARRDGRNMWLVKFLCVKAAACIERDQRDEAARLIYRAMTIGAQGGLCRSLVDEGEHVRSLVMEIAGRRGRLKSEPDGLVPADYLINLQRAFDHGSAEGRQASDTFVPANSQMAGLTARELQILKLVDSGLSNRDLATQLFVSEGTVKWHLRNIFDKLDVANRTGAIGAARALAIL
jgi:LuxR family maltose regulon positive regulatory protein